MIGSTRSVRVWAWAAPADLRKGFDGLSAEVSSKLGREVLSGELFLFVNRTRTRAKVIVWDGTGLCLYHKRLEQGRFAPLWPREHESVELTVSELSLYLEGCELVSRVRLSPKAHLLGPIVGRGGAGRRGVQGKCELS